MPREPRVVLVTGASSGIGLSCATLLAERGWRVYAASRSAPASPAFAAIRMDVTSDESVAEAVSEILRREGRIDAVVNNAGIAIAGAIEDASSSEAREQFDVNVFGILRVCRAVLPGMRERKGGYIVNIGSIGGLVALPFQGLYSASKFAVEGLTESLRMEVRPWGINVVLIEPGDHRTALTANRRTTTAQDVYAAARERAVEVMAKDEQGGPAPEGVARLVDRILNDRRPRLRYTVGPFGERAAVWLKRLGPYSLVERIISGYYSR